MERMQRMGAVCGGGSVDTDARHTLEVRMRRCAKKKLASIVRQ